jgi:HlyD family secretion protein
VKETLFRVVRKNWRWAVALMVVGLLVYRTQFMAVEVAAKPVTSGNIVAEVMGTGSLEARYQTTVGSKIQDRVVEWKADQNDRVKAGDVLAKLDDAELRGEMGVAQATLDAAHATVKRLEAEEDRAKAVQEQAQRDYQRYSSLVESKSISQENVEKTRERLAIAEAEVEKAKAATIEAARQVTTAEEKIRYSGARLADTLIVSPFDGLVVRRDREVGDIVVPGASIFQIISLKELWISAWVDESAMASIAPGQPATIVFRSEPKKKYRGTVARLGREVDRETREFRVDVRADELPANWAVGQRAEVSIETGSKSGVVTIPLRLVVWNKGKPGVLVIEDGRAQRREIVLGLRGIEVVEVVQGLSLKDVLVVESGSGQLAGGQRVKRR